MKISPANYKDLFQDAWLRVWECEQRGAVIREHKSYFYRTLLSVKLNNIEPHTSPLPENLLSEIDRPTLRPPPAFLLEWIVEKTDDEEAQFHKNLIHLILRCKNKSDAINMTGIDRKNFYKYLRDAENRLKNDYINATSTDDSRSNFMV